MLRQEKSLLAKLFFAEEEEWEIKQKILNVPAKYWSKEASDILKRYKQLQLDGKPVFETLCNEEFKKQIDEIVEVDRYFYDEKVDAYIKSLQDTYYQAYLFDLVVNKKEYNPREEILKLNQELLKISDDSTVEHNLSDLKELLLESLEEKSRVKTGDTFFDQNITFNKKNLNIIGAVS